MHKKTYFWTISTILPQVKNYHHFFLFLLKPSPLDMNSSRVNRFQDLLNKTSLLRRRSRVVLDTKSTVMSSMQLSKRKQQRWRKWRSWNMIQEEDSSNRIHWGRDNWWKLHWETETLQKLFIFRSPGLSCSKRYDSKLVSPTLLSVLYWTKSNNNQNIIVLSQY